METSKAHKILEENRLDDYPRVGDLVRVFKAEHDKAMIGCLGVIVGEIGVKTIEMKVVFEPVFPVTVRDGILRAEGKFSEYINSSSLKQYKDNSSYKPTMKNYVNFSNNLQELILVKQFYTSLNF